LDTNPNKTLAAKDKGKRRGEATPELDESLFVPEFSPQHKQQKTAGAQFVDQLSKE
jgi:hypothetical protein